MTPKDKALELYFKYEKEIRIYKQNGFEYDGRKAKNCALITVDELIKSNSITGMYDQDFFDSEINYWNEVKQEIEKL